MAYRIQDSNPHTPRVAGKRQARMQEIVLRALRIAREEGFEALTLQRLAGALGVTPASLYRYFASKDALEAELQRSVIAWLTRATRDCIDAVPALDANDASPGQRALLPIVITAFAFEHFARSAPVEFGWLSKHLSTPDYALSAPEAARVFDAAWQSLAELARHLDAAAQEGALAAGSGSDRALTLWAALQGVVQTRKLARSAADRFDPTELVHGMVPALLIGWGGDAVCVARSVERVIDARLAEPQGCVDDLLSADAAGSLGPGRRRMNRTGGRPQ